jgi:hypothetical protein
MGDVRQEGRRQAQHEMEAIQQPSASEQQAAAAAPRSHALLSSVVIRLTPAVSRDHRHSQSDPRSALNAQPPPLLSIPLIAQLSVQTAGRILFL